MLNKGKIFTFDLPIKLLLTIHQYLTICTGALTTSLTTPTATVILRSYITSRPSEGYSEKDSITIGRSGTSSTIAESPDFKN